MFPSCLLLIKQPSSQWKGKVIRTLPTTFATFCDPPPVYLNAPILQPPYIFVRTNTPHHCPFSMKAQIDNSIQEDNTLIRGVVKKK